MIDTERVREFVHYHNTLNAEAHRLQRAGEQALATVVIPIIDEYAEALVRRDISAKSEKLGPTAVRLKVAGARCTGELVIERRLAHVSFYASVTLSEEPGAVPPTAHTAHSASSTTLAGEVTHELVSERVVAMLAMVVQTSRTVAATPERS